MSADLEFENLVKLYYRDLYRFGLSLTGNETDAADLTQETFYIWANKGHQLQKAANVKGWLFTTLHREFLKMCRRETRFSHESIAERTDDLPNVPAAVTGPFGCRWEVNGVAAIYLPNWLHYHAVSWNPALGRYLRARLDNFEIVHIYGLYDVLGVRVAFECRKRNIPYVVEPIGMFVPIVRNIALKRLYHRFFGGKLLDGAAAKTARRREKARRSAPSSVCGAGRRCAQASSIAATKRQAAAVRKRRPGRRSAS